MAEFAEVVQQFLVDQVDLAQIRQFRLASHAGQVLHRLPAMRVALDAAAFDEPDASNGGLGEGVRSTQVHSDHDARHAPSIAFAATGYAALTTRKWTERDDRRWLAFSLRTLATAAG